MKNPPAVQEIQETRVQIPGSGRSPEGGNNNPLQYSCLENPTDQGTGRLQSIGSRRVGYNLASEHFTPFPGPEIRKASRIWKGMTPPCREAFPLSPKEQPCYPTPPPLPKAEEGGAE